jgi:hypothetical protein
LRFSNDFTEERLLGADWLNEHKYHGDNFIFCIGGAGDLLSQWRAYCTCGGASIGFDVAGLHKYSVLHADFDLLKNHKFKEITAVAVPVLYTPMRDSGEDGARLIARTIQNKLPKPSPAHPLKVTDFVPYIKHYAFHEEREWRLLAENSGGELSECVLFRPLPNNGTKIPYLKIKYGDFAESFKTIDQSEDKQKEIIDGREYPKMIIIPNCSNQRELCSLVRAYLRAHKKLTAGCGKVRIFCDGHLPVRSIKIAPMADQKRVVEQVRRFCKSIYWLQDVKVSPSRIPYVNSINS